MSYEFVGAKRLGLRVARPPTAATPLSPSAARPSRHSSLRLPESDVASSDSFPSHSKALRAQDPGTHNLYLISLLSWQAQHERGAVADGTVMAEIPTDAPAQLAAKGESQAHAGRGAGGLLGGAMERLEQPPGDVRTDPLSMVAHP